MLKNNSMESSLSYLNVMHKASELILVGTDVEHWLQVAKELDVTSVQYIDADERQIAKLKNLQTLPKNWFVHHALLHESSTQLAFYKLSNPALNGTVSGETLSKIWGNLKTIETTDKNAVPLYEVVENVEVVNRVKWLVIDCFNSLDILKGTGTLLNDIEVIMARTIVTSTPELEELSKEKLDTWMSDKGYKNVAFFEENHPEVGLSLYVKDDKLLVKQLSIINEEKEEDNKALKKQFNKEKTGKENLQKELNNFKVELASETKKFQDSINKEKTGKENLQKELNNFKAELVSQTKEFQDSINKEKTGKENLQKELNNFKVELASQTKKFQDSINKEKTGKENLQKELNNFKAELASQTKEFQDSINKEKTGKENLQKELNNFKAELVSQTKEFQDSINKEKTGKENLQKELNNFKVELASQTKEFQDSINKEKTGKENLQKELNNFKAELVSQTKEFQDSINKEKTGKENLQKELNNFKVELEKERQKNINIQKEKEKLVKQNQELNYRNKKFDEQLVKIEAQLELFQKLIFKNKVLEK